MLRKIRAYRWMIIGFIWVLGLALGLIGWVQVDGPGAPQTLDDLIYFTLQLVTIESGAIVTGADAPWMLRIARFLLPAVAAYTTIRVLFITFRERMQWLSLMRIRNHTVICGLGRKALYLARSFRDSGRRVVVIEDDTQNDRIPVVRELGAIVLIGSPKDPFILRQAAIQRAETVIIVDEDDDDNVAIAAQVESVIQEAHETRNIFEGWFRDDSLKVIVHLSDPVYINLLQQQTRDAQIKEQIVFKTFNIFREAAQVMWSRQPDGRLQEHSHLLVIGLGHFGQSLILRAAQEWQQRRENENDRLPITIIDRDATFDFTSFTRAYPFIEELCEFHLAEIDVRSQAMLTGEFLAPNTPPISAAYVCIDNDHLCLYSAFTLTEAFPEMPFPISVRLLSNSGIAPWLLEYQHDSHPLSTVCVLDEVCTTKIGEG
jgi:hypothetical protein